MFFQKKKEYCNSSTQTEPESIINEKIISLKCGQYYIGEIFPEHECENIEFKESINSLNFCLKDILAFFNTSGGTIVFGVNNSRLIKGIKTKNLDETQQKIYSFIKTNIVSKAELSFNIIFHKIALDTYLMLLKINSNNSEVCDNYGNVYIRLGSSSPLKSVNEEIRNHEQDKKEIRDLKGNIIDLKKKLNISNDKIKFLEIKINKIKEALK